MQGCSHFIPIIFRTNPVCLGMKASPNTSDSSSDGRWSLERGHAHQHGPLHDEGSLEHDHTYEALSSLPPRQQPIFEDLPDLPDHFAVMNQGVDVGGYSAVGPTINGSRDVFPTLVDAAKYDEPVCMMMGMGRRSPHPPCPIEDGIAQFNPQLSSSPWSPPNIDLNWCKLTARSYTFIGTICLQSFRSITALAMLPQ